MSMVIIRLLKAELKVNLIILCFVWSAVLMILAGDALEACLELFRCDITLYLYIPWKLIYYVNFTAVFPWLEPRRGCME